MCCFTSTTISFSLANLTLQVHNLTSYVMVKSVLSGEIFLAQSSECSALRAVTGQTMHEAAVELMCKQSQAMSASKVVASG